MKPIFHIIIITPLLFSCTRDETPTALEPTPTNTLETSDTSTGESVSVSNHTGGISAQVLEPWKEINHQSFWHNPQIITGGDYTFPDIAFSYPDSWEFECCGDIDRLSFHLLYPRGEKPWKDDGVRDYLNPPTTFPSITIMSINGDKILMGGSLENPEFLTRDGYLDSLGVDNDVQLDIPNWRMKKVVGSYPDFVDYIAKTDDGLVSFRFNNRNLFGSGFEERFLQNLSQSR